jgi:hypothetical protein
MIQLISPPTLI